jgi:MFS family permease
MTQLATPLGDIAHVIQLAIAPVFLLTAVGTLLNVLTNRLGRAVDRRRLLVARLPELDAAVCASASSELHYLERRVKLIYLAIALAVLCALLICLLIAGAFVDAFVRYNFAKAIAAMFVLAMLALIGSLGAFLREIFLGVNTERCPIN